MLTMCSNYLQTITDSVFTSIHLLYINKDRKKLINNILKFSIGATEFVL